MSSADKVFTGPVTETTSRRPHNIETNLDKQELLNQMRLYLCTALQTSLEIETLLHIFFKKLDTLIGLAGVEFQSKKQCESTFLGTLAVHKFNYQLNTGSEEVGELTCYSRHRVSGLNIEVLELAVSTLVYPLYHALLFKQALEQAETDPLTQLGNRLALDKTLPKLVSSAHRHQKSLSILMIDIDNFKQINDEYGHQIGDEILIAVAQAINTQARNSDMTFRFGGEEFLSIMDNTNARGSAIAAERFRKAIENIDTSKLGLHKNNNVTISIGFAQLDAKEQAATLIKRADIALYKAKQKGKNCVLQG